MTGDRAWPTEALAQYDARLVLGEDAKYLVKVERGPPDRLGLHPIWYRWHAIVPQPAAPT